MPLFSLQPELWPRASPNLWSLAVFRGDRGAMLTFGRTCFLPPLTEHVITGVVLCSSFQGFLYAD